MEGPVKIQNVIWHYSDPLKKRKVYCSIFKDWFSEKMVGKVAIIGAGPSGLSVLCWFAKMKREGRVNFLDIYQL